MRHSIEKRLGYLIGILRKERLNHGDCTYRQGNFIKSTLTYPFEGIAIGKDVCSLSTLSRLENGKHQNSYALLDYFLGKLGIKYKIKESLLETETVLLSRISSGFTSIPQTQLIDGVHDLISFYALYPKDVLFALNHQVLSFTKSVILNQNPKRQDYDILLSKINVYPLSLQLWLIDCGHLLKQLHPEYWNLAIHHEFDYPDQFNKLSQTFLRQDTLDSKHILQSLVPNLHKDSLIMVKLEELSAAIHDSNYRLTHKLEYHACLLSALGESVPHEGDSTLFVTLRDFNKVLDTKDKLAFFETRLYGLLKHEPQPKAISKALGHTIIVLCQSTKTYKPLLKIVALLSENSVEKKSLSIQYNDI